MGRGCGLSGVTIQWVVLGGGRAKGSQSEAVMGNGAWPIGGSQLLGGVGWGGGAKAANQGAVSDEGVGPMGSANPKVALGEGVGLGAGPGGEQPIIWGDFGGRGGAAAGGLLPRH